MERCGQRSRQSFRHMIETHSPVSSRSGRSPRSQQAHHVWYGSRTDLRAAVSGLLADLQSISAPSRRAFLASSAEDVDRLMCGIQTSTPPWHSAPPPLPLGPSLSQIFLSTTAFGPPRSLQWHRALNSIRTSAASSPQFFRDCKTHSLRRSAALVDSWQRHLQHCLADPTS
jgi:hypothetical protein